MEIDNATTATGEFRRHLETLRRRVAYLIVPFLLGVLFAVTLTSGGSETFTTSSIIRVPDPSQSSVFGTGDGAFDIREAERDIASAIELIRGNEVGDAVEREMGDEYDLISLFEVSAISDTLFVRIKVGSLDPGVARRGAQTYATEYVEEQTRLDVFNLSTRAQQLRNSADEIDDDVLAIDLELSDLQRDIVEHEFAIRALEGQLSSGIVPRRLIDLTIELRDFQRRRDILLSDRTRQTQEQQFLRQEASNLDIEQSYRQQTGAQIVSQPEPPTQQSGRSLFRDAIIFGTLGLMVGAAAALAREYFYSRVKGIADLNELAPEVPVLGALPKVRGALSQAHLAVATHRPWYAAEAYRALRTTLFTLYGERQRTFVFSSVGAGAGKSVTVTNLAVAVARTGMRTLVIDANFRRPSVHMKLGVSNEAGTAQLLLDAADPTGFVQPSQLARGLDAIPAGPLPSNPAELLGSIAMIELLDWAQSNYDVVMIDSPPLDVFTDATVIANQVGGVFLVIRIDHTDLNRLDETLDQLRTARVPIQGFIVNGRQPKESRAMRYARRIGVRNIRTLWTDRPTVIGRSVGEMPVTEMDDDEPLPVPVGVGGRSSSTDDLATETAAPPSRGGAPLADDDAGHADENGHRDGGPVGDGDAWEDEDGLTQKMYRTWSERRPE